MAGLRLGGEEQAALALVTYPIIAAAFAAATHNPYTALVASYIIALAARGTISSVYTRVLLIVASIALLPLTPLLTTPSVFHAQVPVAMTPSMETVKIVAVRVEKIPLPLHVLLVYRDPHTGVTTRVLALDWGQVGLVTLLVELYLYSKAKKG